jgi:hypothetical protein
MGYQPNDFVNPNQRGVELPAGCKDLTEVLKKDGRVGRATGRPEILYGVLSENPAKDAVARMVTELLVEAFGVLKGERLMLISCEGARA